MIGLVICTLLICATVIICILGGNTWMKEMICRIRDGMHLIQRFQISKSY